MNPSSSIPEGKAQATEGSALAFVAHRLPNAIHEYASVARCHHCHEWEYWEFLLRREYPVKNDARYAHARCEMTPEVE